MGENIYILGVCSFITIISFLISIYISIKTKNIDSRIKELKAGTEFNNSREKLVNDLITYQTAIKNISSYKKLRLNLLNDLNTFYYASQYALIVKERKAFNKLIREVEKTEKFNINKIHNTLSRIIGFLNLKKEDL